MNAGLGGAGHGNSCTEYLGNICIMERFIKEDKTMHVQKSLPAKEQKQHK